MNMAFEKVYDAMERKDWDKVKEMLIMDGLSTVVNLRHRVRCS